MEPATIIDIIRTIFVIFGLAGCASAPPATTYDPRLSEPPLHHPMPGDFAYGIKPATILEFSNTLQP